MTTTTLAEPLVWPEGVARVPFRVFSDAQIYALEQERTFRGPSGNFLCLEADVARAGDGGRAWAAETQGTVTRAQ